MPTSRWKVNFTENNNDDGEKGDYLLTALDNRRPLQYSVSLGKIYIQYIFSVCFSKLVVNMCANMNNTIVVNLTKEHFKTI